MRDAAPVLEDLGHQVRQARVASGLSQEELALLAGTSRRPIYLLETGRGAVRLDSLIRILEALGMKMEFMSKGSMSGD
ncbi:transcriptional regulator [bacterium]|nr:MAG: transcriptional regulator [bacterium]